MPILSLEEKQALLRQKSAADERGIERAKLTSRRIWRRILDGATGYQLLCANCHKIKTFGTVEYEK